MYKGKKLQALNASLFYVYFYLIDSLMFIECKCKEKISHSRTTAF